MKEAPEYLKELSRVVEPALGPEDAAERRMRMIASIERSARSSREAVARARRRRRFLAPVALVAPVAAAATLWLNAPEAVPTEAVPTAPRLGGATEVAVQQGNTNGAVENGPSEEVKLNRLLEGPVVSETTGPLHPGERLGDGLLTVGGEEEARLRLASGARVEAYPSSRLWLRVESAGSTQSEVLTLDSGTVALRVPHLGGERRLLVETAEAVTEVRGTAFRVSREKLRTGLMITSVSVSEGLVSVRSNGAEVFLGPGDEWESGRTVDSLRERQARAEASSLTSSHPGALLASGREAPPSEASEMARTSDLAEQNRLYQSALLASRNGLPDLARIRFRQLLRQYPHSPLIGGVRRELTRLDEQAASGE